MSLQQRATAQQPHVASQQTWRLDFFRVGQSCGLIAAERDGYRNEHFRTAIHAAVNASCDRRWNRVDLTPARLRTRLGGVHRYSTGRAVRRQSPDPTPPRRTISPSPHRITHVVIGGLTSRRSPDYRKHDYCDREETSCCRPGLTLIKLVRERFSHPLSREYGNSRCRWNFGRLISFFVPQR